MSVVYRGLNDFLSSHKAEKGGVITHTCIGNIGSEEVKSGSVKQVFPVVTAYQQTK